MRAPTVSPRAFRRLTAATVAVTAAIVVSGGAVRLTASGLGCPTWPNCTAGQLDASGLGWRGAIEFGNRVVTVAITALVALCAVASFRLVERRRDLRRLSLAMVGGILGNAVIGGVTVLTHLHPGWVAVHFLFNMALLVVALALHARAGRAGGAVGAVTASRELLLLARGLVGVAGFVLFAGTLATGSGPHGGDAAAPRFHLAPLERVTALHADAAMVLVGLVATAVLLTRVGTASPSARRRAAWLGAVVVGQAGLGFAQYLLDLPAALVLAHIAGATVLWCLAVGLLQAVRAPAGAPGAGVAETVAEPRPEPAPKVAVSA